ncbi:MAG: hypothetical protein KGR16_05485 [Verrucomicrobia bacterium]|nr:hypothetical protein [Verrucomicrobiota bacterium]
MIKKEVLIGCACLTTSLTGPIEGTPFTPESVLPEGVDALISTNPYTGESGPSRKGTVVATLKNVALLNSLLLQKETLDIRKDIATISAAIDTLIPSLRVIGLFDLFEPMYWIGQGEQPGRILALVLYLKQYPEKYTLELQQHLLQVKEHISSPYLQEQLESLSILEIVHELE